MEKPGNYFVSRYAEALVVETYQFIQTLPASEIYNLVSQMRRSATSIDDNIREGAGRQGDRAMLPFLYYANASAAELLGQYRKCAILELGDGPAAKKYGRRVGRLQVM